MTAPLFALQTAAPASGGMGLPILAIQVIGFIAVFYFLILRPQGVARKKHAELLGTLKKGDDVMTAGGIVGKVREIKEVEMGTTKETRVTVESGTATVVVERSRIVRVGSAAATGTPA